jgi:hypothetical protein
VASRGSFLLRLDPQTLEALRAWSRDELRSINGQIEYLLRRALADAGRLPRSRSQKTSKTGADTAGHF